MKQHIIDAAHQDRAMFIEASTVIFTVLANKHDFRLSDLTVAEGNRLLGFLETMRQSDHPELLAWSPVMFTAAVQTARSDIEAKLAAAHAVSGN